MGWGQGLERALRALAYCSTGETDMTLEDRAGFLMQPLWFFWWD